MLEPVTDSSKEWADAAAKDTPVYYDLAGRITRVVQVPGFPSYGIIDLAGRVRFTAIASDLADAVRKVAALIWIEERTGAPAVTAQ